MKNFSKVDFESDPRTKDICSEISERIVSAFGEKTKDALLGTVAVRRSQQAMINAMLTASRSECIEIMQSLSNTTREVLIRHVMQAIFVDILDRPEKYKKEISRHASTEEYIQSLGGEVLTLIMATEDAFEKMQVAVCGTADAHKVKAKDAN